MALRTRVIRISAVEQTEDLSLTTLERAQPVEVETGGFEAPRSRAARVPIAAGIGFLLGCGLAIVVDRLDDRIRDRRRAEQAYGVPVVAELPSLRRRERGTRLLVGPAEHTHAAESYRTLRTSLAFLAAEGENPPRCLVVLVTSASPAEGKTTVSANLAAAFAETGQKVVVANADFRRPKLGRFLSWWRPDPSVITERQWEYFTRAVGRRYIGGQPAVPGRLGRARDARRPRPDHCPDHLSVAVDGRRHHHRHSTPLRHR